MDINMGTEQKDAKAPLVAAFERAGFGINRPR